MNLALSSKLWCGTAVGRGGKHTHSCVMIGSLETSVILALIISRSPCSYGYRRHSFLITLLTVLLHFCLLVLRDTINLQETV